MADTTRYYVYAIMDSNIVKLVCSTNASAPTGFDGYRLIGEFISNGSAQIDSTTVISYANIVQESIVVRGQAYSEHQATVTPSGTTQTIDWNEGNSITIDLDSASGDVTLTLSNPAPGASYVIKVIQGATARDLIWPATVLWSGGSAPVISTTNNDVDMVSLFYDGANFYGSFSQGMS